MKTELLKISGISQNDEDIINRAAEIIKTGGIVGVPTETVYGLAGSAFIPSSVGKIYSAKGRPADNPLIVHIASPEDAEKIAYPNEIYYKLADKFMPGPLTIILKKKDNIPYEVTAGLDTVAVRCPANPIMNQLIRVSGHPIAAPSANRSGAPSPTNAKHVFDDMNGKIDMIIDGGECEIGLESTVIKLDDKGCTILRPGAVTAEMLSTVCEEVRISKAVIEPSLSGDIKPESPGMKYKHYSPKANIVLIDASPKNFADYVNNHATGNFGLLIPNELSKYFNTGTPLLTGVENDYKEASKRLFSLLRQADELNLTTVYAICPPNKSEYLAYFNRLVRAAGCNILKLSEI